MLDVPATAQHEAYRYLRDRILDAELPAEALINPAEIAEHLGISRMPVREALRQLDAEGLVSMRPNRRAVVTRLSVAEVEDLFEMRAELESLAVRSAVQRLTEDSRAELTMLMQRMDRVRHDRREWIGRHDEFHQYMCELSGRKRLSKEIWRIRHAVRPYILMFVKEFDAFEMQGFEHSTLLEAVLSEDVDFAAETMRHHVREPINGLKAFLLEREAEGKVGSTAQMAKRGAK
jgi:DNA-binding GntR family transcriptional regulator